MNLSIEVGVLLVLALIAANLPFLNPRWLLFFKRKRDQAKPLAGRLLEGLLFYGLVLGCGFALEAHRGQVTQQGWEFYVVTLSLFGVLMFPGFVWRYLWPRHE